ncbi:heparinase II/III domain-containing protein [Microlunatus sp. Y2014]|uniref:heparinase II/III domain-containing protein n=1 Tax=Microlunatus sp. Y2014 TaxID=3418488 RepID=UPI003DA7646B
MKRRSFLAATTGAALAAGLAEWTTSPLTAFGAPPAAPAAGGPVVSTRTDLAAVAGTVTGMTIDGTMADSRWGTPHWQSFTTLYDLTAAPETALHIVHDATTLYVGVRVSGGPAATVSHVSLLIGSGADRRFRTTTVQLRAIRPSPVFEWGGSAEPIEGHRSAFDLGDQATCEIAVPLSALGVTGDPATQQLTINVVLDHDDQTDPVVSSVPTRTSSSSYQGTSSTRMTTTVVDEDRGASIHLGRLAPVAAGRGTPELVRDVPVTLGYVDHTHKSVTFDLPGAGVADIFRLDWRAPGGRWAELTGTTVKKARAGFTTTVEHPPPTAYGQYELRISVRARSGSDRVLLTTFDRHDLITAGDQLPANRPHPPRGDTPVASAPPSPEVSALLALIPDRTGFTFCGVPDNPGLHPNNTYTWSADRPDKIIARSTGTAYPNDAYPEDKELVVTNRLGEQVSYPYHEDAEGKRYFLSGHLWYLQRNHVYGQLVSVASEDPLGGARLLHKFAQVFQGWVPTNEYPWHNRPVEPAATPRNHYWGGLWNRWSIAVLGPLASIGAALAIVEQTNAFDVLSEEVGHDVRELLISDTIEPSVDFFNTYTRNYTNNDYPSYVGLAGLAKGLGDSRYTHQAVEWAKEYIRRGFLFDGFWEETTLSYHLQSINGLAQVASSLKGWTDAEGYVSPRSGERYADLDLLADYAVLGASQRVPNVLCYPDGKLFPMADTWAYSAAPQPENGVGSVLFGAAGVARLSRGRVPSAEHPGEILSFLDLTATEQTVEVRLFPASGTVQFEANEDGQSITYAFEVADTDEYDLDLQPFHAGSYGIYQISVDGTVVGEHDFYDTTSGVADYVTIGRVQLTAGEHSIRFLGQGMHADSTNYKMGLVNLALLDEAARAERDNAEPPGQSNPSQTYLQFTPKYGHNHWDSLDLTIFAEGQELFPDFGYSHTRYRAWGVCTLGHNTVVVDSANMNGTAGRDGGSVEVFDHDEEPIQVVRAEFSDAYPQTSRYQREVWSIEHPGTDRHEGYVLDLFRVAGGERHEFTLNGDANRDAELTTTAELTDHGPYLLPPGVEVIEPETEVETGSAEGHYYGYIFVRDVKKAALPDGAYDITLATTVDDQPAAGAHLLGLAGPDTELFLGRSPSFRATRVNGASGDTNDEVVKWNSPKLVLRREGTDLTSTFVTMIEPHAAGAQTRIASIESVAHNGTEDDMAIKVTHADGTVDVIISSLDDASSVTAEGVTVTGKLGFARLVDGTASQLRLVGGTRLTAPGRELTGTGAATGTLTATRRRFNGDPVDALVTADAVPDWVVGRTVVVTHPGGKTHGYPIKAVSADGGSTTIELDTVDPGFSIAADGSSAMEFTPFTTWTGATTFRVENGVTG